MGSTTYIITITAGAAGPLVLESSGCFYFILFYFFTTNFFSNPSIFQFHHNFYHKYLPQILPHSLPQTITTYHYYNWGVNIYYHTNCFLQSNNFSIFTTHFTTHVTTTFTTNHYNYLHRPPTMFSVPKRNTYKCFERPANIFIASN